MINRHLNFEELEKKYPNHNINYNQTGEKGSGYFGIIKNLVFGFRHKNSNITKIRNYVVKNYRSEDSEQLFNSLKVWEILKKNNFETYKFYRRYNEFSIIMENLSLPNNFCISTISTNLNSQDSKYLMKNKITEILNFEDFVESYLENLLKLCEIKLNSLNEDFIFIIGEKSEKTNLKIFFGDLDLLTKSNNLNPNFQYAFRSIKKFLELYVDESSEKYKYYNDYVYKRYTVYYRKYN